MTEEYKVVMSSTQDSLERQITEYLRFGWKAVGGICISHESGPTFQRTHFTQATTRKHLGGELEPTDL